MIRPGVGRPILISDTLSKKEGWTFEPKGDGPDTSYKSAILEALLAEDLSTILVAKQR